MTPSRALVVFDIDGTLFQTDRVTVPAVQRVFARYGLPVPGREAILDFFGKPVEAYEAWLAAQCSPDTAQEIVAATNALELELIGAEGQLYPHAKNTLEQLRTRGYLMAICSNGPDPYVQRFLDVFGLRSFFAAVFARDVQYSGKEEMLGLILEQTHPTGFVVIGDRRDDVDAAHVWEGWAIAAAYGFGDASEWGHADAVIQDIQEAPTCIAQFLAPCSPL